MKIENFKLKLSQIDNGCYIGLIAAFEFRDACSDCYAFSPLQRDPGMQYRCRCLGSCPAETLSKEMKSYLWWKLGVISREQHVANCREEEGR